MSASSGARRASDGSAGSPTQYSGPPPAAVARLPWNGAVSREIEGVCHLHPTSAVDASATGMTHRRQPLFDEGCPSAGGDRHGVDLLLGRGRPVALGALG